MKIAKTSRILTPITDWLQLSEGQCLQKQTQHLVNNAINHCFGYHLLKLGKLSAQLQTNKCPIKHQINCAEDGCDIGIRSDLNHLPFQDSTIDVCLLAHELDFSSDPHQLLREIDRVLTLDGILILTGYNPYSLFGLKSLSPLKGVHSARLLSPNRVVDWLHLLGFEIKQKQHFDYMSPQPESRSTKLIESIGQRYLPFFCSAYFIQAQKKSTPMTTIKPNITFRKRVINHRPIITKQSHTNDIHQQ